MRALWIGLIGAVMATGAAAEQVSCWEHDAVLVGVDRIDDPNWSSAMPVKDRSHVGQEFRIIKRTDGPTKNSNLLFLRSGQETYVVRADWGPDLPHPAAYTSTTARAGSRPPYPASLTQIGKLETQAIRSGPLQGIILRVHSCLKTFP